MYTEIKEVCNFLVRYLRYRIPCQTLKDYIERLANLLVVMMEPTWDKVDDKGELRINVLHWHPKGTTSDVFYKAAQQTGMTFSFLKALLPEKLIFAVSSGLVTYQLLDDPRLRPIWEGTPDEDLEYDPSPMCTKFVFDPPLVSVSKTQGERLHGKPLVTENFDDAPAFLTDPMMLKAHFVMQLIEIPQNSFAHDYIGDYKGKIFKVERYSASRQPPSDGLIPVSKFHKTKFGTLRPMTLPPLVLDTEEKEEVRAPAVVPKKQTTPPPKPRTESSSDSSTHSDMDDSSDASDDLGPMVEVPILLLQRLLNPEQKLLLRNLNYPCE